MMLRIHYLQHVPFEGPGSIEPWANSHGHTLTVTRLYAGDQLPPPDRFDILVILGGPMSVHDEFEHVWLKAEKWFIKQAIDAEKPILGICLGAQLLAEVLGGKVMPGEVKEIGWYPITLTDTFAGSDLGKLLPKQAEVFHWHGETFTLPEGSVHLASSDACPNQGFIYNERIVALQFHLETTRLTAESLIENSQDELQQKGQIQTPEEMLADDSRFDEVNRLMEIVLQRLGSYALERRIQGES